MTKLTDEIGEVAEGVAGKILDVVENADHEQHIRESKILLGELAVVEAEKKADHTLAKKKFEEQRDYVMGLEIDDSTSLFDGEGNEVGLCPKCNGNGLDDAKVLCTDCEGTGKADGVSREAE